MSDTNPVVLTATEKTRQALGQAAPWMFFLAVVGYIGAGFLAVVGLLMLFFGGLWTSHMAAGHRAAFLFPFIGVFYVGIGLVVFFATRRLHRISSRSKAYGQHGGAAELEDVAVTVRSLAKYWGIFTIVLLAVYFLVLVGALIAFFVMPRPI